MENEEIVSLVNELQKYDNKKGYKLSHKEAEERLDGIAEKLAAHGKAALAYLHPLLESEETWSCLFALRILGKIRSGKSISHLIEFIRKNEDGDYWEGCDDAMLALRAIGEPAVDILLEEVESDFRKKAYFDFLVGALTGIKSGKVYSFMAQTIRDYLENHEKYDGWFDIESFTFEFDVQGKKESIPLLRQLLEMDLPEMTRREIEYRIEAIEDPEKHKAKMERIAKTWKQPPAAKKPKDRQPGRNDRCPCGSGKKYKKCCLGNKKAEMK